jgi:dTDP-4-amino-4,6-dideoxygalactose transaminase
MIKLSDVYLTNDCSKAVNEVLKSGIIAQGPKVSRLETEIAELCNTRYAVAVNNGTAALHTALYAVGIKAGDEVITTPFTFVATANSIVMTGATPVFVDIEESTYNLDPQKIEAAITARTKAIIVVNLFGQPASYAEIKKIATKYKLLIIEDAAQSINAEYNKAKSGNLGDIACFSFYATKNITSGEGGMITTNNKDFYKKAKLFRHHGQNEKKRYEYTGIGYNYRMTDIHAAIALTQLKRVNEITKKRQKNASRFTNALKNIRGLITPKVEPDRTHAFHQYTLRVTKDFKSNRDTLMNILEKKGIQSNIYYPKPLYRFTHLSEKPDIKKFPVTERMIREVLSIPVHPRLTQKQIYYIINTIKKYAG